MRRLDFTPLLDAVLSGGHRVLEPPLIRNETTAGTIAANGMRLRIEHATDQQSKVPYQADSTIAGFPGC